MKSDRVFTFLLKHQIDFDLHANLISLLEINSKSTADYLLQRYKRLSYNWIVESSLAELAENEYLTFVFLKEIFDVNPDYCKNFVTKLLDLAIKYDPHLVFKILETSDGYSPEKYIKIFHDKNFVKEEAYLLSKIGN